MGKISILLISVLFVFGITTLASAAMCGKHTRQQSKQGETVEHKHVKSEAQDVGNEICPVLGEKIDEKTKVTYEYKSKIYNLCCPGCKSEFEANTEKYIGEKSEEEKETYEHKHMMH